MRFKRHVELKKGQLDIAPLIDVVFLLLIFFMLTSSFMAQKGIKVNLPNAVSSEPIISKNLIIYVTAKNELLVGDETLSFDKLDSRIAEAARAKKHILIKADKKASMGKVVAIWDLCRDAGISNINIATGRK
ncbi:MAG: biopolymer transporter ExbD [Candidatus Omnitrophica bacterium]|nr:biopolymer transporter ExbD [Candidatus Omnitrophota bacterium]